MSGQNGKRTVVFEGTTLTGTISARSPVLVMGRFEGELTGPAVEVSEGGVIVGKVKADALRSRGELSGTFDAADMELGGQVVDGTVIRAGALTVAYVRGTSPGMVLGRCELEIGDAPDKATAVSEAISARARPEPPPPAPAPEAAPAETPDADDEDSSAPSA
jgi:cytoskeletal protein CcmA (bactofilin family)